jgi:hypothetical protein
MPPCREDVNHVGLSVCSAPRMMSSFFVMTVSTSSWSLTPTTHHPTEFGLYVDKHGDPSRSTTTIEWEGTAERVAIHSPYILLFDTRFIEIRHVQTGRLAQIIPGNDVHCIWDGRGITSPMHIKTPDGDEDDMQQEARVHAVMNASPAGPERAPRAMAQHVFELIPTIPLYLPGSLASPATATYFPQSFSPPHSPQLRPVTSYRS